MAEQSAEVDRMIASKEPVADREDTAKRFNLLEISFNDDDSVKSYVVNQKKLDTMLLTAGFFASKTIVSSNFVSADFRKMRTDSFQKSRTTRFRKIRVVR